MEILVKVGIKKLVGNDITKLSKEK